MKLIRRVLSLSVTETLFDEIGKLSGEMGLTKSGVVNYLIRLGIIRYNELKELGRLKERGNRE